MVFKTAAKWMTTVLCIIITVNTQRLLIDKNRPEEKLYDDDDSIIENVTIRNFTLPNTIRKGQLRDILYHIALYRRKEYCILSPKGDMTACKGFWQRVVQKIIDKDLGSVNDIRVVKPAFNYTAYCAAVKKNKTVETKEANSTTTQGPLEINKDPPGKKSSRKSETGGDLIKQIESVLDNLETVSRRDCQGGDTEKISPLDIMNYSQVTI